MSDKLVWVDVETTGLNVGTDKLLEIAVVITDHDLNELGAYHTPIVNPLSLSGWDAMVVRMHSRSGLLADVHEKGKAIWQAQDDILDLLRRMSIYANSGAPLAGSTVQFDRAFLKAYMAKVEERLHYRNVDVSTVKQLVTLWAPGHEWAKGDAHRALDDIRDSIAELRHYRKLLFSARKLRAA